MYHLRKNPRLLETAARVRDVTEDALGRLRDSSAGLTFDPEPHRYYLGGQELRSVSSIVESFAPFNAEATAARCSANPRHELHGVPVPEILRIWEKKGRDAADAGTLVHEFAEGCYLYMTGHEDEITEPLRSRITADGFAAESPKEEACARWWAENDWNSYAPVAKESRLVNPQLRYAGTMDLLLFGLHDAGFHLRDWKTNADLYRWFGGYLRPPLKVLKDNDVGKYTLQQTLYTIQLRNINLDVRSNELIWLRDDGHDETVPLDMQYAKLAEYAVRQTLTT